MNALAGVLPKLREKLGMRSAHAFFRALGGSRHFGCTYKQYLNVESGRSIPGPALAERIALGLRLESTPEAAREFAEAWLRCASGSRSFFTFLSGALASPDALDPLLAGTISRSFSERTALLTSEQVRYIHSSAETFWAFNLLVNDVGLATPEELSNLTGLGLKRLRAALEGLARRKLAVRERRGFRTALAGKAVVYPQDDAERARRGARARRYCRSLARKGGTEVLDQKILLRASERELAAYLPRLRQALQGAGLFAVTSRGKDTALFLLETKGTRVLSF